MSLAIETGILADRAVNDPEAAEWVQEDFRNLNTALRQNGLPEHVEPAEGVSETSRAPVSSFPYLFLHQLRRVAAYRFQDPTWVAQPFPEDADPLQDPVLDAEYGHLRSHLVCHSDSEGYYLPFEFEEVIFDEELVPGVIVGSSQRLLDELRQIAPALDIRLEDGELTDAEVGRLADGIDDEEGLWKEWVAWLALFEAARISVEERTAIAFC